MWNQLRTLLSFSQPNRLTITSHGQETCDIPFEQVKEVMEWLGLSLMAAGYEARAHIIWDSPVTEMDLAAALKGRLKRDEPAFLYRCGNRPTPAPKGYYWRLMPEYPNLRVYQLEPKDE